MIDTILRRRIAGAKMRSIRNDIIGVATVIAIAMGIFPPWSVTAGPESSYPGVTFSLGYAPIFDAPMIGEIALTRLFIQWILVAALALAAIRYEQPLHLFLQKSWKDIQERTQRKKNEDRN